MTVMQGLGRSARALAMLAAVWAVLGGAAWALDALPRLREPATQDAEPTQRVETPIARPVAPQMVEAPEPVVNVPDVAPITFAGFRFAQVVCPRPVPLPSDEARLAIGEVLGGATEELLVACGSELHVLAFSQEEPLRALSVRSAETVAAVPSVPLVVDYNQDGFVDIVFSFAKMGSDGGPSGGGLWLLPGDEAAPGEARLLAPIHALATVTARDDASLRIGAIHWTDGFGRRASEFWLFAGTTQLTRSARTRLGNDATSLLALPSTWSSAVTPNSIENSAVPNTDSADPVAEAEPSALQDVAFLTGDSESVRAMDARGRLLREIPVPGVRSMAIAQEQVFLLGAHLQALARDGNVSDVALAPEGIRRIRSAASGELLLLTRDGIFSGSTIGFRELLRLPATLRPHDAELHDGLLDVVAQGTEGFVLLRFAVQDTMQTMEAGLQMNPVADAPIHFEREL